MRSLVLAGELLEFCGHSIPGSGRSEASRLLDSGAAWAKFQAICEAQGGLRGPGVAPLREAVMAERPGYVCGIDNRRLARVAKLAGAPGAPTAGLELHVKLGGTVERGMLLFTLNAEEPGELAYAKHYLATHPVITLADEVTAMKPVVIAMPAMSRSLATVRRVLRPDATSMPAATTAVSRE